MPNDDTPPNPIPPVATPADPPKPPPPGWPLEAWNEYHSMRVEHGKLKSELQAREGKIAELTRAVSDAATRATNWERNAALTGHGIKAPSVQRALRRGYDDYAGEAGEGALPFAEWIEKEAKGDPLFSPHFVAPSAAPNTPPPASTPPAPPRTPASDPTAGRAQPPSPGAVRDFTDDEVNKMSDAEYRANRDLIEAQLLREGGIATPIKRAARSA